MTGGFCLLPTGASALVLPSFSLLGSHEASASRDPEEKWEQVWNLTQRNSDIKKQPRRESIHRLYKGKNLFIDWARVRISAQAVHRGKNLFIDCTRVRISPQAVHRGKNLFLLLVRRFSLLHGWSSVTGKDMNSILLIMCSNSLLIFHIPFYLGSSPRNSDRIVTKLQVTLAASDTLSQAPPTREYFPSPIRDKMTDGESSGPTANGVCLKY